jgi:hypothetical protein
MHKKAITREAKCGCYARRSISQATRWFQRGTAYISYRTAVDIARASSSHFRRFGCWLGNIVAQEPASVVCNSTASAHTLVSIRFEDVKAIGTAEPVRHLQRTGSGPLRFIRHSARLATFAEILLRIQERSTDRDCHVGSALVIFSAHQRAALAPECAGPSTTSGPGDNHHPSPATT